MPSTGIRFNYGRVAQPPDFRYFLDSTIGDSLRTDIRRQGNPNLAFEKGSSYEAGINHLFGENVALGITAFRKTLDNLVSGNLQLGPQLARIILNEVVGANPSLLRGTIEVAGQRADIVVANPNGISCDGCGFLNTGRASQMISQDTNGVLSDPEAFDGFAVALAAADFNGDGPADLVVGVPGELVGTVQSAGAINVLFGTTTGVTGTDSQVFHQGVAGIGSDPEAGDFFGLALGVAAS
jgi:filamentous hemagglutinin family protein